MCDKLVFDLSQEVEGSPSVFIRKDWINMLDNQNQNYNSNQSIIDTSQICNSNKYMSYREAYLSIPFTLTLASIGAPTSTNITAGSIGYVNPAIPQTSLDYCMGLKNWFGQIIHSFTMDYNGTTIIQQTPYINMWNSFRLLTSMSLDDINVQGPTIGFFPDDSTSWQFIGPNTDATNPQYPTINTGPIGNGTCNNTNLNSITPVAGFFSAGRSGGGNEGFIARQQYINFDLQGSLGTQSPAGAVGTNGNYQSLQYFGNLLQGGQVPVGTVQAGNIFNLANGASGTMTNLWKGFIFKKQAQTLGGQSAVIQIAVTATIYLRHIHSFFNFCPLIKGAFMKMTLNLNNTTTSFVCASAGQDNLNLSGVIPVQMSCTGVQNPLGGVNPLMIASGLANQITINTGAAPALGAANGSLGLFPYATNGGANNATIFNNYRMNISVGAICLDQQLSNIVGVGQGPLSRSIYLYIPSYTFNPPFEQAYLSNPVKNIKYTDVYQYQVINVARNQTFSNLITNGIANIKSVLILPFYCPTNNDNGNVVVGSIAGAQTTVNYNTGFLNGTPVWQSPYDPAGTGPTSPLTYITNFNVQISGQNAIYNTEKYLFEQFNNQLYGQNAVNGGMTDGLNSGLISKTAFENIYSYYYVNVERMLPAEQSVPKSVQIIGQNLSAKALDLMVFIEFGVDTINIDILTGARV